MSGTFGTTSPSLRSWNWSAASDVPDMRVLLFGRQGASPFPMVVGQLLVGGRDRLGLRRHSRDVLARDHHVELVLAEVGVHPIADAARARADALGQPPRPRDAA